jgi:hypothetical protein
MAVAPVLPWTGRSVAAAGKSMTPGGCRLAAGAFGREFDDTGQTCSREYRSGVEFHLPPS